MRTRFLFGAVLVTICAGSAVAQVREGVLASDEGGADGYQHSVERSRFVTGSTVDQMRPIEEYGFLKVVGPNGVFATNLRNGLTIATQNEEMDKSDTNEATHESKYAPLLDPEKQNAMVMEYFVAAGIPREQVGGVHANTDISAVGAGDDIMSATVRVDGYTSILERVAGGFPVPESIAWARLDNEGASIGEFVYWPAIPAKALADARLLNEMTTGPRTAEYMARLPANLPPGVVVIHHSAATDEGPFEALATYDVLDSRRAPDQSAENMSRPPSEGNTANMAVAVVRHFDVEGVERRLPYEQLTLGTPDPRSK